MSDLQDRGGKHANRRITMRAAAIARLIFDSLCFDLYPFRERHAEVAHATESNRVAKRILARRFDSLCFPTGESRAKIWAEFAELMDECFPT